MAKFETYVSGKGEGSNRYQFMQVLTWLIEAAHSHKRISVTKIMEKLDASREFVEAIFEEFKEDGIARYNPSYPETLDYNYNWQNH